MQWTGNHARTLSGFRVLDLTRLLPGPFCTLLLADLGADVIKLEAPVAADYVRFFPPQLGRGADAIGALFATINRGKRSLTLNLKDRRGREAFLRLIDEADVVVESFRPGVMDRLGLGLDELTARKPDLIYCAISGYGQDGPMRERAGHDLNYIGLTGALEQTGQPGGPPTTPGFQLADVAGGGLYAALAIVSALLHRHRTGEGATLDISMTEGALTFASPLLARLAAGDRQPDRGRDQLTGGFPCYRVYATSDDRFVALAALEPKFWSAFCRAVEQPSWSTQGHRPDSPIAADVEALFRTRSRDEWVGFLAPHDICCEPILTASEALEHELFRARQVFFELGGAGRAASFHTATPVTPRSGRRALRPAPRLGEHSVEILSEAGLSRDAIDELIRSGATSVAAD